MIRRQRSLRRTSLLFAALAVGAILSACGGDDDSGGVSANTWANEVCGQITAWQGQVQAASTSLQTQLQTQMQANQANVQAVRDELVKFLDNVATRTGQMITNIDEAGVPDTANGEQVATELKDGLEEVKKVFDDGKAKADDLPVDNQAQFQQGAQELSTSSQAALERVGQRLQALGQNAPELNQAFGQVAECKQLSG